MGTGGVILRDGSAVDGVLRLLAGVDGACVAVRIEGRAGRRRRVARSIGGCHAAATLVRLTGPRWAESLGSHGRLNGRGVHSRRLRSGSCADRSAVMSGSDGCGRGTKRHGNDREAMMMEGSHSAISSENRRARGPRSVAAGTRGVSVDSPGSAKGSGYSAADFVNVQPYTKTSEEIERSDPVTRHEVFRQLCFGRSRLRRVRVFETHPRRQRHQDRLGAPARLQAEQRAAVVN